MFRASHFCSDRRIGRLKSIVTQIQANWSEKDGLNTKRLEFSEFMEEKALKKLLSKLNRNTLPFGVDLHARRGTQVRTSSLYEPLFQDQDTIIEQNFASLLD